jgi:sec-independent protein translocase protein TatA
MGICVLTHRLNVPLPVVGSYRQNFSGETTPILGIGLLVGTRILFFPLHRSLKSYKKYRVGKSLRWSVAMFGLGYQEILLILIILFLLFGVKKLPEIGKGLGETVKEIRKIRQGRKSEKEKDKRDSKADLISDIKKEVAEIPGLKEAKKIKETADQIKNITKILK